MYYVYHIINGTNEYFLVRDMDKSSSSPLVVGCETPRSRIGVAVPVRNSLLYETKRASKAETTVRL